MTLRKKNRELLEDLVRAFYYNDSQMKRYKMISDEEKAKIKDIMRDSDISDFVVSGIKAKYITSKKENMDEDMLLTILKKNGLDNCVKTIEVVDMDALENAIYHNEVPNSVLKKMDACRKTVIIESLRVTKVRDEEVEG
jgi:hypothetical protein